MICIVCGKQLPDGAKKFCPICIQELQPDVVQNSIIALEQLQIDLAVSINRLRIAAHDNGRLNADALALIKRSHEEFKNTLADIGSLLGKLRAFGS